jgi:NAD-dependent dihydropyrimidine dehydrogenase PreA subunit
VTRLRYIDQAVTLELDSSACTGCGVCVQVCPRGVFEIRDGRAALADRGACIECGACELNCAFGALRVEAGVGCAQAIITGWIRGTEPSCGDGCCS